MSELRHRGGEGDGNDKVETAGESDHVTMNYCFFPNTKPVLDYGLLMSAFV